MALQETYYFSLNIDRIPATKIEKFDKKDGTIGARISVLLSMSNETNKWGYNRYLTLCKNEDEIRDRVKSIYVGSGKLSYGDRDFGCTFKLDIELTKIPRIYFCKYQKKDGTQGTTIKLCLSSMKSPNIAGDTHTIYTYRTKEQRANPDEYPLVYVGNGRVAYNPTTQSYHTKPKSAYVEDDNAPF
jgi:hypothetical protein